MNIQKNMGLIVGCGLAAAIAIAAAVLLIMKMSAVGKAEADLKSLHQKLSSLERRTIYPNQANKDQIAKNLETLTVALSNTITALRKGQINEDEGGSEFAPLVEEAVKKLKADAAANAVALPPDFGFGFDDFLKKGIKPSTSAVARLSIQLRTTAMLCNMLYAARISNIVSVSRENLSDTASQSATADGSQPTQITRGALFRDAPPAPDNELYKVERFGLEFTARENAVWEVLNSFAKGPPHIVVRDAVIETAVPAIGPGSARASATAPSAAAAATSIFDDLAGGRAGTVGASNVLIATRDERIVSGRENVKVSIIVDVYRFEPFAGGSP